jgi:hypothetical protein
VTGLGTVLLGSHQIKKIYSVWKKKNNWLNYIVIELWRYNSMKCYLMCFGFQ